MITGLDARINRLILTVRKLAQWHGADISELIEEGYLQEGDLEEREG
jgi:hypothetical protein